MIANSLISTHVLDTSTGHPAAGVEFELARKKSAADGWEVISQGITDADGRAACLPIEGALTAAVYRLQFAIGAYFKRKNVVTFYPTVTVEFSVAGAERYHVPLLISPFGYSTYRGS